MHMNTHAIPQDAGFRVGCSTGDIGRLSGPWMHKVARSRKRTSESASFSTAFDEWAFGSFTKCHQVSSWVRLG
jgi:hypothetical protein